jgi:hypothetical protein
MTSTWQRRIAATMTLFAFPILGVHSQAAAQGAPPAVGDRVAVDTPDGLKGVVVRIGGPGDASYVQGCYGVHFDYETSEPDRVQWNCPANGNLIFRLAANPGPPALPVGPGVNVAAMPVFALNDRVLVGGLAGTVAKIGGAGDPSGVQGCYGVHFDYERSEPARVQWSCPAMGHQIDKLAAGPVGPVAPVPAAAPAAPAALPQRPLPIQPAHPQPAPPKPPVAAAPTPEKPGQGGANVHAGRYECYGASGPMGGFNFAIAGPGAYTDIGGKAGSYSMAGGMMTFHGGAHDGERATFFPALDARHPAHITFENTLGGGLGISCDAKA